jgi:glycine/D-amino acid oxidase-like deaminating enzyme/nitrite reductase/ring-hydroxylating ferredoxin subunit
MAREGSVARSSSPEPLWIATAEATIYPALDGPEQFDVLVVGGGITGVTTALLTQRAGYRVGLIEADRIGLGATARSTVKVTSGHSLKYSEIERIHGAGAARLYASSNQAAVEQISVLVEGFQIECDFERRRHVVYAETDEERDAVRAEVDAEIRAGLPASFEEESDLPFPVTGCLVLDEQAQFHPLRYVQGLAAEFAREGGSIFENTRVLDVEVGEPCVVRTERGEARATHVVVATRFPIVNRGLMFAKMAPVQEYAVAGPVDAARSPRDMYISAGSESPSLRTYDDQGETLLIVVGEKHKVGEGDDEEARYQRLADWASDRFGMAEVRYRWTTHDLWPVDRLPYIGRIGRGENIYVATGFGAWGMTNGTVAGLLLTDLIDGTENQWIDLYDPSRSDISHGFTPFVRENVKVAAHWLGDRLKSTSEAEELGLGEAGILLQDGGEHVAAYRDVEGLLHAVSASCTHLGCLVSWNGADRTWDCPCHGSRFGIDGDVVSAPAVHPLPPRSF